MALMAKISRLLAAGGAVLGARAAWTGLGMYDLSGKTVLITGGSRGLGLVLARELLSQGAKVAVCARDQAELERAGQDLASRSPEALAVICDVTDQGEVAKMVRAVRQHFGPIDVLINNAGVIEVGPLESMTPGDFEEAMRGNFGAALYTTLAVLPEMRARQSGRIVNITSIGGKLSVPHLLPYSASKFALVGFSEGLRAELRKDGIVVTTVVPGLMRTGSPRNATFKGQYRAEYAWFSITDSMPFLSMSAERAARQIIAACRRGDAEIVLSVVAQIAVRCNALFPALMQDLLGLAARLLPAPGGSEARSGKDSLSVLSPSWLTALGEKAAQRNNEIGEAASPQAVSEAVPAVP